MPCGRQVRPPQKRNICPNKFTIIYTPDINVWYVYCSFVIGVVFKKSSGLCQPVPRKSTLSWPTGFSLAPQSLASTMLLLKQWLSQIQSLRRTRWSCVQKYRSVSVWLDGFSTCKTFHARFSLCLFLDGDECLCNLVGLVETTNLPLVPSNSVYNMFDIWYLF